MRRPVLAIITVLGALLVGERATAQSPFKHQGLDLLHPPDSALPNEQVDPASGTLTVVATDLVLPGNAGLNLAVQRVYNSAVFPDYDTGSTAIEEDSWAGIGWKLHFGRIIHADSTSAGQMQVEMGDGSRHPLYHSLANPNIWTTSGFWLYNPATHTLQLPDGRVYVFDREVALNERLGTVRYVTEIRDRFQNRITFGYFDASGPADGVAIIQQHVSASQIREVTFTYDATHKALASMTYLDHTWNYDQTAQGEAGHSKLDRVRPPQGPATLYEYNGAELTAIVAPFGGRIAYSYTDAVRRASTLSTTTRVVATRTMSGHGVQTGAWTFAYSTGENQDTTTITSPCGGATTSYRFNGTGLSGDFTGWRAGTLAELTVREGGSTLETRTMTWIRSEPISSDPVSGSNGIWSDDAVYQPLLQQQTTTRGSQSWTTNFSYRTGQGTINDYGHPNFVEEMGTSIYQWRRTTRTFQYGFTPYLLGVVASESSEQNSAFGQHDGSTNSSWHYNLSTGFLNSQTIRGMTTTFEPRADGNVNAVVDARGHRTAYSYSWGRVSAIDSPTVDTTFVVSAEGLLRSATQGALTTTYDYDDAMRLAAVNPPASNPITYVPDDLHGTFVRVLRGSAMTEHVVDGFGREIVTSNSQFLKVERQRDTCGRVVFTSDPFTATGPGAGTQGTSAQYDALGRLKQTTDSAGKVTTLTYSGSGVSRTDANNRTTAFAYMGFGDPANAQLASVTDAAGKITSYRYDVTGALTRVLGPESGLQRSWVIGSKGLPDSDTQPESGMTTYVYDAVGNLFTATDANNQATTFTHDASNRLTLRNAPGTDDDLAITYDTTGRIETLSSGGTTTTFTYDVPARKVTRTDVTPAGTFTSIYKSDANDNLSELTYPSGRVLTYHYDGENRLTSFDHQPLNGTNAVFAHGFSYGDDGRLASYVTGAVTHRFTYEFNRTKRLWTTGGSDALDLTYGYDNVGNVSSVTDPRPNANQTFVPDPLDRLETATGPWGTLQWSYDAAGNRLSELAGGTTTTYTYNTTNQRLTSTSGGVNETFGYDNVGRVTSDAVATYSYSPTGKLTGATGAGVNATYTYDASGERFSKTVNGQTTYSLRSVGGQTLTEFVGSCGTMIWSRDLLYAGGQPIGAAKATTVQPSVAMVASAVSANEGTGTTSVNVRLTTPNGAALGCPVTVSYAATAGSAAAGADFTQTPGSVTFPTGAASGSTQSISVSIAGDAVDEPDETFTVGISSALGATVSSPSSTTVTIVDDDLPQVSFSAATSTAGEGAGSASIVVSLATAVPLPSAVSVSYGTANGSAAAGQDYTASSGSVSFPAGSTNGATQTIVVSLSSDSTFEANETFSLSMSAPSGALLGSPSSHTVTIVNDDLPTVSFSTSASSVGEGGSSQTITVTLGTGIVLPSAVSVVYSTANGSAVSGVDYGGVSGSMTFNAGATNGAAQTISVPIYADSLFEGNESFSLSLSSPSGAWIVSPSGHSITIVEDDLPTIAFSAASSSISEAGGTATMTVTLGTAVALPSAVSVSYQTSDGSAVSGQDYVATSGAVTFSAGSTQGATRSISVSLVNNGVHEPTAGGEVFYVALSGPSGASIASPGTHAVVITEDDPVPNPIITLELPANGAIGASAVTIGGWAIDTNAPSGTGITAVSVYAYPNADESQPAIFLGTSPYGGWRGDVAGSYGSRFGPSGFTMGATMPGPGVYRVRAFGWDPLAAAWQPSNPRDITVQPTPRMNIDTPATGGSVASWFPVQGWAIDAGAGSGTGVDAIHVYAYPNPGSGQPAIFLGAATYGGYRSDVAGSFGGQFGNSGYGLSASLGAGYYQVVVYARSTVTASWSQAQSVYVTVAAGVHAAIETPAASATVGQPFNLTGWALDASSSSGNGVPFMHAYVYLHGATPQFLGAPSTVAGSRPNLGAWLQASRFSDSGWGLTVGGLPVGTHLLVVYPYSSVTGSFAPALLRWVTVQ